MRAGAFALSLISSPLNVHVLEALQAEPMPLIDLRRALGAPPQTTMRGQIRALEQIGLLERHRQVGFPRSVSYELTGSGQDLGAVAEVVRDWLALAPERPLELGSTAAKSAIKALVDGWSSTIVRALAARPLALTELNKLISGLNYPSLERRLSAMRLAGQVEARPSESRTTPYGVSVWLRRAVAPLAAGARWERRHAAARSAPIGRLDVESAFLLALPLVRLASDSCGRCRLAVEVCNDGNGDHRLAGVLVEIREGRMASCTSRLQGDADAWVSGRPSTWIDAVIDGDAHALELGGDCELATSLLHGLNRALFRTSARESS